MKPFPTLATYFVYCGIVLETQQSPTTNTSRPYTILALGYLRGSYPHFGRQVHFWLAQRATSGDLLQALSRRSFAEAAKRLDLVCGRDPGPGRSCDQVTSNKTADGRTQVRNIESSFQKIKDLFLEILSPTLSMLAALASLIVSRLVHLLRDPCHLKR